MKHVRLDGADRAAERGGDLVMRHVVVHPENQRGALLARQLGDGRAHPGRPLGPQQSIVGALAPLVDVLAIVDRFGDAAP